MMSRAPSLYSVFRERVYSVFELQTLLQHFEHRPVLTDAVRPRWVNKRKKKSGADDRL